MVFYFRHLSLPSGSKFKNVLEIIHTNNEVLKNIIGVTKKRFEKCEVLSSGYGTCHIFFKYLKSAKNDSFFSLKKQFKRGKNFMSLVILYIFFNTSLQKDLEAESITLYSGTVLFIMYIFFYYYL